MPGCSTLARAYFINVKLKEAIGTQKKAIELESNNEQFRETLAVYEGESRKQLAARVPCRANFVRGGICNV